MLRMGVDARSGGREYKNASAVRNTISASS